MRDDVKTKVKIAVAVERDDQPCWPCINYDYDKELARIIKPITQMNPNIEFTVQKYTDRKQAEADYDRDLTEYNGILVLLMTCWKSIDIFYAEKFKEGGLPLIIADVPLFGSGSMLSATSSYIREHNLAIPLISSLKYEDIAEAVNLLRVIHLMEQTKILVITDRETSSISSKITLIDHEKKITNLWGCEFVNKTSKEFNKYYTTADSTRAKEIAQMWKNEAADTLEPSDEELLDSAKIYLALDKIRSEVGAHAVTVDCLGLSYLEKYLDKKHMYPCLSHYEMLKHNIVAVCEADLDATVTSLLTLYLTKRQGFVSDPAIDTSSNQIIYAHCVACDKIYGCNDPRRCKFYIRSHAEDKKGASVQAIFPAGEKLTTVISNTFGPENIAGIHSACSVGNVGGDEGCRSKLAAVTEAEKILYNYLPGWHRVTVFGDYRNLFKMLFKIKHIKVIEEDK